MDRSIHWIIRLILMSTIGLPLHILMGVIAGVLDAFMCWKWDVKQIWEER